MIAGKGPQEKTARLATPPENRYQLLVENSYDTVAEFTADGTYLYANQAHEAVLGYKPEELVGLNAFTLVHPEDREKAGRYIHEDQHRGVLRYRHKNGRWRWLELTGSIFQVGNEPRMVISGRDITNLAETQKRLGVLAGLARMLGAVESFAEAARVVATAAKELCGWDAFSLDMYSAEEHRVIPVVTIDTINGQQLDVPHGYVGREPSRLFQRVLDEGPLLILRPEAKFDGSSVPFGASARASRSLLFVPLIEQGKTIGIASAQSYEAEAYTEEHLKLLESLADHCAATFARLRAQENSREAQSWFQAFMDINPAAVSIKDQDGRYLYVNRAVEQATGRPLSEWIGRTAPEMLPEKLALKLEETDNIVLREGVTREFEETFELPEGEPQRWQAWKFPLETSSGRRCVGAMLFDVREREKAREALRLSEEKFRSVFQQAPVAICIAREGLAQYVNQAFLDMFGLGSEAEALGRKSIEFVGLHSRVELEERIRKREAEEIPFEAYETIGLRADGQEFPLQVNVARVRLPEGTSMVGFMVDLTQRRSLESQLMHSQKLESVGRLAGGVAHDFNNLLTVIKGYASILESAGLGSDEHEAVEQISIAASKAAALTTQLLAFSRKQVVQLRTLDLNNVVQQMTRMLGRVLGEDIGLELDLEAALPMVKADAGMLDQVIMNLAVNARDAMPQGGRLRISTSVATRETDAEACQEMQCSRAVCLEVRDTGVGIPAEHLPKIFEPFFTTKAVGAGTGLGLATVYGIVKQHAGAVRVASVVGEGARFRICLPALEEASPGPPKPGTRTIQAGSGETILVVEDDLAIRNLVKIGLKRAGYEVIEAGDATEGLARFKGAESRIALVLTDVVMPGGISGKELAAQIRAVAPQTKIIFSSGYAPGTGKDGFTLGADDTFLAKPYKLQDLLEVLRKKLEAGK